MTSQVHTNFNSQTFAINDSAAQMTFSLMTQYATFYFV